MSKSPRKLTSAAVAALFARGQFVKGRSLSARYLANGLALSRCAPIVGKKLGNAVRRNRIKRRLRAAWREIAADIPAGFDFAVLARVEAQTMPFPQLVAAMKEVLKRV
ncbi:MAG: ribonuclease P protein component [Planctomycetota bacterium]|jgi:ribonuclease P protein component|nr:ribonuclease P protein component [Planctomycetota bacterium]